MVLKIIVLSDRVINHYSTYKNGLNTLLGLHVKEDVVLDIEHFCTKRFEKKIPDILKNVDGIMFMSDIDRDTINRLKTIIVNNNEKISIARIYPYYTYSPIEGVYTMQDIEYFPNKIIANKKYLMF